MANNSNYGVRSSSSQETHRPNHRGGVSIRRRGGTSPSDVSSSGDSSGGGAALSAGYSNPDVDNGSGSSPVRYVVPNLRSSRNDVNLGQTVSENGPVRTGPHFQLGNVTDDDGDVFNERFAGRAHTALQGTSNISAIPTETIDDFLPRNRDTSYVPWSVRRARNATSNDALLASPEARVGNEVIRATSSYGEQPSYSMALRAAPPESSARHQVGRVDAQAFYSPAACVFVANLPEGVEDIRLEAEVTRQFSDFGTVFVKIRRDARNMPFAFCQFTDEGDAKVALTSGKGRMIYGRACRTENVRANRTYIMHRSNGDDLEVEEARLSLIQMRVGVMEKCEQLPDDIQTQQGLGRSVLIKLKRFDPLKELQGAFRNHHRYRVIAYDEQKGTQVTSKPDAAEAWLNRYEVDRRSIFIGDLPYGLEDLEGALREVLGELGDVVEVQIITRVRDREDVREPYIFAFVEFTRPDMATIAVERLSGRLLFGREVRIERKSRKEARPMQRWNPSTSRDTHQSPRYSRFENQRHIDGQSYGMESPVTPGRPNFQHSNHSTVGTPGPMNLYGPPFDGRDWGSPLPSYTTSPYANPPGSAGYNAVTPQMPAAYGGQMTPYGYYPATNYNWMSPYMFNPVAVTQAAYGNQMPADNIQPTAAGAGDAGDADDDETPDTPTRRVNRKDGEA